MWEVRGQQRYIARPAELGRPHQRVVTARAVRKAVTTRCSVPF